MFRLANPADFFREYSESPKLKFKLAWLMVAGFVVPAAILAALGLPEKFTVYLVLVGMVPFQYAAYCILRSRRRVQVLRLDVTDALREMTDNQRLWLAISEPDVFTVRANLSGANLSEAKLNSSREWAQVLGQTRPSQEMNDFERLLTSAAFVLHAKYSSEPLLKDFIATEYVSRLQSRGLRNPNWHASREPQAFELRFPFATPGLPQQAIGR